MVGFPSKLSLFYLKCNLRRRSNIWICFNEIKTPHGYEFQDHSKTHFKPGDHRWGQPFLSKNHIDAINVVNLTNHWYQTKEMEEALPIITKYIQGHAYENVITSHVLK